MWVPAPHGVHAATEFVAALKKPGGQSWHAAAFEVLPRVAQRDFPVPQAVATVHAAHCDDWVAPIVALNFPDGQGMHADSELCMRALVPASAMYFPAAQSMQGALPHAVEYFPAAQTVQSASGSSWLSGFDASCELNVPAGQEAQSADRPVSALAFPAEQTTHEVLDVCPGDDLNLPAAHGMQAATLPESAL
jgi:hypothetical protein